VARECAASASGRAGPKRPHPTRAKPEGAWLDGLHAALDAAVAAAYGWPAGFAEDAALAALLALNRERAEPGGGGGPMP
jgi:hypothetical protein